MALEFNFQGVPVEKEIRIKNAIYNLIGKETAAEVTETDVKNWIKTIVRRELKHNENLNNKIQAEQNFLNNYEDAV